jgi:hypothetical protein
MLVLSRSAMTELFDIGCDMYDVLEILESGYDCSRSKRAGHIIEKCLDKKGKTFKVVIAGSFNFDHNCEVWVVTHFGITSKWRR